MTMGYALEIAVAFLPIMLFLLFMKLLDSFKLVSARQTLAALCAGVVAAILAMFANQLLYEWTGLSAATFSRMVSPVTEEVLKILLVIYLIQARKLGFLVDAAIAGFAVGAGFAIVENIYYMRVLTDAGLATWLVRGFGTAVMHGGATAIAAIIGKDLSDRKNWPALLVYLPGLLAAIFIHALFNLFLLPPLTAALLVFITLPPVMYLVFRKSEENTREWLGTGLDSDTEMLRLLLAGNISGTRIGNYLKSIQEKFPADVVGDMICYLRVYLELSIKAKGVLIMKESGFDLPGDPDIQSQFDELAYLEKNIGKTGMLAVQPLLNISNTDLWQLYMLQQELI